MQWDLTRLYKGFDDPNFAADYEKAQQVTAELEQLLANPEEDACRQLVKVINTFNRLETLTRRLSALVHLTLSVEAQNEEALAANDKMQSFMVRIKQCSSALSRYVGGIENLDEVIAQDEVLREHAFMLRQNAKAAAHTIDPALEETVLKLRITGSGAWSQLRGTLESTVQVDYEDNGVMKKLPLAAVRGLASSPDQATRKRAYEAELAAYPQIETPMAACMSGMKGEALTMLPLRHYNSLLEQTLEQSRMDQQTLDAMLTAMKESLPDFRRYMHAKAKYLGHKHGLPFWELFAPLGNANTSYTLDEARQLLVDVLGKFSKKMADHIQQAFDERWIDAYPRAGKRGGAFCSSVHPVNVSYVMTNFDGSLNSVCTLAHELGHAYHNRCLRGLSMLNCGYPMPLAETASIFNETLLTSKMLETATPEEQIMLLEQEVSDANQVIVDILSRYIFETEVIERRKTHALSSRELQEIMLDAQRQSYGDGLDPEYMHPYMWACKSHYYRADLHFYNFPYAFGLLFGKGIFARYMERGDAFVPEYDQLLRATATGNVADVAASVGIDVRSVDFWRSSLQVFRESIDKLCELLEKN
ncbi:MAG: M3 family oligoendopeptidase [Clostridia bacterium]|nr:M3 family oligoendopeptidase [Clostridia bacterium]